MTLQQTYCNDLYDLNTENTELYEEHRKWYNEFRACSVGDLLDKQQDMIDSYKRAVDNSTMEIADLRSEITALLKTIDNNVPIPKAVTVGSAITDTE